MGSAYSVRFKRKTRNGYRWFLLQRVSFLRKQEQYAECPDAENQARQSPKGFMPSAVTGDDPTKHSIECMTERRRRQQRRRLHVGSGDEQSGEITEQAVKFHERALTLPSASYYTQSLPK